MKRYFINNAKCGVTNGGMACGPVFGQVVASVEYIENEKTHWLSIVEVEGILNPIISDEDIFDLLIEEDDENEKFMMYVQEKVVDNFNGLVFGEGYPDIFVSMAEDPENPAIPLIRYMIALIRCEMKDVERLIAMAIGKYADELDIPVSDIEEEYLEELEEEEYEDEEYEDDEEEEDDDSDFENEYEVALPENLDKEDLYRMRMFLEADIKTESVFHDLDYDAFKAQKRLLKKVQERCKNEEEYLDWKRAYIEAEYEKIKDHEFLTCNYLFAGIGQYEATFPVEQKESFICWIRGNGSAFMGSDRKATEEEIKTYIALQAGKGLNIS